MAYNTYFPQSYQPFSGFNPYQQPVQQNYQQQGQNSQPQIQNGGFVSVRSIEEAYNWPVSPGNSITFKDENAPYIYTKTKGFSQLEAPIFERFRLVKEEDAQQAQMPSQASKMPSDALDYDKQIKDIWNEINALKTAINANQAKDDKPVKKASPKKEVAESE